MAINYVLIDTPNDTPSDLKVTEKKQMIKQNKKMKLNDAHSTTAVSYYKVLLLQLRNCGSKKTLESTNLWIFRARAKIFFFISDFAIYSISDMSINSFTYNDM